VSKTPLANFVKNANDYKSAKNITCFIHSKAFILRDFLKIKSNSLIYLNLNGKRKSKCSRS